MARPIMIAGQRIIQGDGGCWLWQGDKNSEGYGRVHLEGRAYYVHRVMYQVYKGPISYNQELDHLCRVRHCCNPDHLEAVASRDNSLRGNHPLYILHREKRCKQGHSVTGDNVFVRADGRHRCRICYQQQNARNNAKRRFRKNKRAAS